MRVKILISAAALFVFFVLVENKGTTQANLQNNKTLRDKPSVYLTFERVGKYEPICADQPQDGIILRLHNNSPWAINIDASPLDLNENKNLSIRLESGDEVESLDEGAEVKMCYEIEQEPVTLPTKKGKTFLLDAPVKIPLPKIETFCSCKWRDVRTSARRGYWIRPAASILFSIPRKAMKNHLKVYTSFHYEWESVKGDLRRDEPRHQVYFYASDLPETLRN